MRILVVYYEVTQNDRRTISEHLNSFRNYSDHEYIYLNAFLQIPFFISYMNFDVVIYHYTYLSQKWNGPEHFGMLVKKSQRLKNLGSVRIAMPQDEYVFSDLLNKFFKEFGVKHILPALKILIGRLSTRKSCRGLSIIRRT